MSIDLDDPLAVKRASQANRKARLANQRLPAVAARARGRALDRGCISPALAARIVEFVSANPPKTLPQSQLDLLLQNLGGMA